MLENWVLHGCCHLYRVGYCLGGCRCLSFCRHSLRWLCRAGLGLDGLLKGRRGCLLMCGNDEHEDQWHCKQEACAGLPEPTPRPLPPVPGGLWSLMEVPPVRLLAPSAQAREGPGWPAGRPPGLPARALGLRNQMRLGSEGAQELASPLPCALRPWQLPAPALVAALASLAETAKEGAG